MLLPRFLLYFVQLKCFTSRIVDIASFFLALAGAGSTGQNVRRRMEEYKLPGTPKPLRLQYLKYAVSTYFDIEISSFCVTCLQQLELLAQLQ